MVESTGPVVRPTPIDPLAVETWPLACVLVWIRAEKRGWSWEQTAELMRNAYREEAVAFPAGDPPLDEGRHLIDYAASHADRLSLHHAGGVVAPSQLGPDAVVLPTIGPSGRHTFGLWLRPHSDVDAKLLDLWCIARQVRLKWPGPRPLTLSERKRNEVSKAIRALGVAELSAMPQKEREAKIIARVQADSELSVKERLVRQLFSEARKMAPA